MQRRIIYKTLSELGIHTTAERVYERLTPQHPTISKATVYRNLRKLADDGDIADIGIFNGATHFDINCHAHHHFMCDDCKRVFDVQGDFTDVLGRTTDTDGFDIASFYISFGGLCWTCKPKSK